MRAVEPVRENYTGLYLANAANGLDLVPHVVQTLKIVSFDQEDHVNLSTDGLALLESVTRSCARMKSTLTKLKTVVDSRFALFQNSSTEMWKDLNATRFREFESMIQSNHTMIGGVLCALTVKLDAWTKKFPNRDTGGPTSSFPR